MIPPYHPPHAHKSEEEIFDLLRKGRFMAKLKKWPSKILGKQLALNDGTIDLIRFFNDVRGDLTHPKTQGHDIYEKLETFEPKAVIDSIAEFIVRFHEAQKTRFPYWVFGWNYLNPRPNTHEIFLINDQQFFHSLQAIGFEIAATVYGETEAWLTLHLGSFDGYLSINEALKAVKGCEPKFDRFPFKPILCRRWWTTEHHLSCGHVTDKAIDYAKNYGS
jgi:hypothetical protein